ncbi:MAG: permease [Candidatus Nanoarchaeia archaeon]
MVDVFYPLQLLADWITYSVLGIAKETILASSVNFFIYDIIKIFILLCAIIFGFAIIRSFLPPEKIKNILTNKYEVFGNVLASLIGIVTPFCSCSAVPLFIGFVESGIPLGVTFSYLIAAPMINEVAVVLLLGLFGWKIAAIYVVSGLIISIVVGYLLGRMKLQHLVQDYVWKIKANNKMKNEKRTWKKRMKIAYEDTAGIVKRVFPWVILGVGIGAFIHGYVPENLLTNIAGKGNWFAVPIAVLIGVPLYSNAAGMIPVVKSLMEKGLPLGTSLAFMMAVTALSLPEMIILRKVLKPKLLMLYFGIVTLGIIFTGYLFNFLI